jgi:hypothetical protein
MTHAHRSTDRDCAELFFALSGGLPVTQIVLGTENDLTSIGSAGIDGGAVPALLVRLGRGLTGEAA